MIAPSVTGPTAGTVHNLRIRHSPSWRREKFVNLLCQQCDLIQIKVDHVPHRFGQIDRFIVHHAGDDFKVCRPLGYDQPKLGQIAAQGVDQLRALPDKALVGSERYAT